MRLLSAAGARLKALMPTRAGLHEWLCSWAYSRTISVPDTKRFSRAIGAARRYAPLGGWALTSNALRALVSALQDRPAPRIVEFGSGVSTVFLDAYFGDEVEVDSYEHQPTFAERIKPHLRGEGMRLHTAALRQLSDEELAGLLFGHVNVAELPCLGRPLEKERYADTRVRNAFYDVGKLKGPYDAMILDGPNGNGRSVAFALMKANMTKPGFILVDDCNHYEFLCDCSLCFRFNVLYAEIYPGKRWALLQVEGR